jgi:hypothetical protein
MTKQEILAAAGYPNTPEGIAAFYNEYGTPDAFFAKHGGSLSGAPHDGQPTADQFFNYGSHVNDKLNVPMSNPFFLKQGGTYYGGPTRPYAYGGDVSEYCWGGGLPGGANEMPEMLEGGYNSPMNYGSFPAVEWGGALDASNEDEFPMMEQGGANLSKIIKAASKKMKKAYASGGNTTIQGGNQNFLENRNNTFTNSIKNNVYNAFIKEEEKAAMQALNPYATGMEQDNQEYPEARYGLSTYRKRGEKQPDDVPIDFRKTLPDLFPTGRDYSKYLPANIQSQYVMSNADYARMHDLNKRLADKTFQLNKDGFKGTPEWGPLARMLGKTGRRMFGPKSVTYEFTGRGTRQVPVKDVEQLNLPGFQDKYDKPEAPWIGYHGAWQDANATGLPDYLERDPNTMDESVPLTDRQKQVLDYMRSTLRPSASNKKSDENIQLQPTKGLKPMAPYAEEQSEEYNPFINLEALDAKDAYDKYMKSKQGYGRKKYGGILGKYQNAGQTGGLTPEQYNELMRLYDEAAIASKTNKRNDETLAFQQAFHTYQPTKQIAEGLLAERQAANQPTTLGRTLGKDKMYSLASNEDKYFGNTTQQYLAELQKLKPQASTPQAQPAPVTGYKPTLTDMNVPDTGLDLNFKAPLQKPAPLNTGAGLQDMNVNDTGMNLNYKNPVSLASSSSTTPTQSKADIIGKAKGMDMRKLKPELNLDDKGRKELIGPTDTEVGPEEKITSKINRKTSGIAKAIGQYAPGAANAWASILEQQPKLDPMQNQPVVLGNRGDYDINTGDFRVDQKVPVQFPGGPGAYRMEYGGIPKALSGLEVKMRPGLYGTNGNRQFSLPTQVDSQKFAQQPTEVRNSLTAVPRDQANLEAEGGETAMVNIDGMPAHFKISGKRHSQGGVPLDLPDNSFIFSDTASMRIKDPNIQKDFGLPIKKGGYTPAEIAKKYDINKFRKILSDPNSEDLERKTAEGMIANYNMKLAKLSLIQESMKGFPQGMPVVAMPYMMANNVDPAMYVPTQGQEEQPDEDMGVQRYGGNIISQYPTMKYGGLSKYQEAGQTNDDPYGLKALKDQQKAREKVLGQEKVVNEKENEEAYLQSELAYLRNQIDQRRETLKKALNYDKKLYSGESDVKTADSYRKRLISTGEELSALDNLSEKLNTPGYKIDKKDFQFTDSDGLPIPINKTLKSVLDEYAAKPYTIPGQVNWMKGKNIKAITQDISKFTGTPKVKTYQEFKNELPVYEKPVEETSVKNIEVKKKPATKAKVKPSVEEDIDLGEFSKYEVKNKK